MKNLYFVVILAVFVLTCGDDDSPPPTAPADAPSAGTTRTFTLNPYALARDRYVCTQAGADQACYERGYEKSTSHGSCMRIDNSGTLYLTGVTCWKP